MMTTEQRRVIRACGMTLVFFVVARLLGPTPSDSGEPTKLVVLAPFADLIATGMRLFQVRPALRVSGAAQAKQALSCYMIAGTLFTVGTLSDLLVEEPRLGLVVVAAAFVAAMVAECLRAGVETTDRRG
jgi:hypothetical protein